MRSHSNDGDMAEALTLKAAPIMITVPECLRILCLGRTKFYEEVKAGRIAVVKVGRKTLVPSSEPDKYLQRLIAGVTQSGS